MTITTLPVILMMLATVQDAPPPPTPAPRAPQSMREVAPPLARYTDDLLFGDVWKRPGLSPRDRSLVTVSALIGGGKAAQLTSHLNIGLDNGLTPDQLSAIITNAAFYAGWPNAVSAVGVAQEVFKTRGVAIKMTEPGIGASDMKASDGDTPLARYGPILEGLWQRGDLSPRDRALSTLAVLIAGGDSADLPAVLERGRLAGLSRGQVEEALLHLSFYAGRAKAEAAARSVAAIYGPSTAAMSIVPNGSGMRDAPAVHFVGRVHVGAAFSGSGGSAIGGATVAFEPGARTNWHRHPTGQTLAITKGCGWTQVEGGPVRRICAGDVVQVEPGAKHWHGATRSEGMTHVAMSEAVEGASVSWLEPVTDAQYRSES